MTSAGAERRRSLSSRSETFKFPEFDQPLITRDHLLTHEEENFTGTTPARTSTSARTSTPNAFPKPNGLLHSDTWQPRKENHLAWGNGHINAPTSAPGSRHARQKSLSDAIKTIRTRKGSVSANAQEIAEALKAPVSIKLIVLCLVWYMSSALTNTSSKSILNAFPQPITLTLIQFAFVSSWCILFAYLAYLYPPLQVAIPALKHGIRYPTREVIYTTLPLALFQIGGHILSSTATSKIPVSLVHTIKGLSPLFTVLAYRFLLHIRYSRATYLSLIPLTFGVILACSVEFSGNLFGILCAFGGALIFVTQNIFSKQLFNEEARTAADALSRSQSRKLDKLNLLCYCSGLALLLTFPLWLWTEGFALIASLFHPSDALINMSSPLALSSGRLALEFIFNGIFHFTQNILAFVLLSLVSPVTYSVASLIKRVFVIVASILWFGSHTTPVQAVGIALTFIGLYLYDRTSDATKADRKAKLEQLRTQGPLLPLAADPQVLSATMVETPINTADGQLFGGANGGVSGDEKKADAGGPGGVGIASSARPWLLPGTRQEETWRLNDRGFTAS